MKNYSLAEIHRSIPYIPALRPFVGSVTACILMQQLDFWFSIKNGAAFYKFLVAQKGDKTHSAYKEGDSWCEELSMSPDEFRCAFDKIGFRYKSFSEYKRKGEKFNPFQGRYYASYHDKIKGLTWYLRNHDLVDSLLFEIFTRKSGKSIYVNSPSQPTYKIKAHLPKSEKSIPNISDITTKITAENTTTELALTPVVTSATHVNQISLDLLSQIPAAERSQRLIKAMFSALTASGEDYTKSNVEYCLAKHRPQNGANSLGGMIVSALANDYAKAIRSKANDQEVAIALITEDRRIWEEQEKFRIDAKTEEDRQWCESESGQEFVKQLLSNAPL